MAADLRTGRLEVSTDEFRRPSAVFFGNGTTCWRLSLKESAITHLYAGVAVADLEASIDWYTRLFGRSPDYRAGDEILWEIAASATLFIEPDAQRAGTSRITLSVTGLDALLESLAVRRIDHEAIETYANGVRHVKIPDPDGNAIAFAEPPGAA